MSLARIAERTRLLNYLLRCAERASQRRVLLELDDHLLRDIGLSRRDALIESARPFWRTSAGERAETKSGAGAPLYQSR